MPTSEERVQVELTLTEIANCRDALTLIWVKLIEQQENETAAKIQDTRNSLQEALDRA